MDMFSHFRRKSTRENNKNILNKKLNKRNNILVKFPCREGLSSDVTQAVPVSDALGSRPKCTATRWLPHRFRLPVSAHGGRLNLLAIGFRWPTRLSLHCFTWSWTLSLHRSLQFSIRVLFCCRSDSATYL